MAKKNENIINFELCNQKVFDLLKKDLLKSDKYVPAEIMAWFSEKERTQRNAFLRKNKKLLEETVRKNRENRAFVMFADYDSAVKYVKNIYVEFINENPKFAGIINQDALDKRFND